jgi:uncharacterized damage-inducible protein DinB/ribosomal protein S18 acetylase RimI-like enzyme
MLSSLAAGANPSAALTTTDIRRYLEATAEQSANARIGPFLAGYDGNTDNPNRNYATPVAGPRPTIDDVSALVAFYRRKNRLPRLEYVVPAGAVERSLTDAAFVVDEGLPLMTATGDSLRLPDLPPGIELRLVRTEAGLSAAAATQNAAYGEPGLDPADVRRLRRTADAGGFVVAAVDVDTGETVGAGLCTPPVNGIMQITSIGVAEGYRRRGIAATVSADLARRAFDAGTRPFLDAAGSAEERIYAQVGYVTVGRLASASLPTDRTLPRIVGDERQTTLGFLTYLRDCLVSKLLGVDEEQLRRSTVPTGTCLLGLVKHVAAVETFWMHFAFAGEPEDVIVDDELTDADTAESVISFYREVEAHTRRIVADHGLDDRAVVAPFGPPVMPLRWVLTHLIEETGRHAGQADIIREQLDGSTGR